MLAPTSGEEYAKAGESSAARLPEFVQSGSWLGAAATGGFCGFGRTGRGVFGSIGLTGAGRGRLGFALKMPLKVPPTGLVGVKRAKGGSGGGGGGGATGATSGS